MKNTLIMRTLTLAMLLGLSGPFLASSATAGVLIDPVLVSGANAIDPTGSQTVDQIAPGAISASLLENLWGFAAVQDFTGWSTQGTTNYIVFTTEPNRPSIRSTYSGETGSSPGGATTSDYLETSPGESIGIDSGATRTASLTLDFGSAELSGSTVTSFDSTALAPTAVSFTVCGLADVTTNVTVTFYGSDDTTVLSTQVLLSGTDPDSADGTTYGSDGYVGYQTSGTGAASGIGKVVVVANQVIAGNNGIAIDDLGFNTVGNSYYMTVAGAGAKTGADWANALAASSLTAMVNTTMVPGDVIYLGSGNYGQTSLGGSTKGQLTITSSGNASQYKHLVGIDTGAGLPVFDSANWSRIHPTKGNSQILVLSGSSSYWEIADLVFTNAARAIKVNSSTPNHTGLAFSNISITNVEHGMYVYDSDNMTVTNCFVTQYTKHAFRLEQGCDNVTFNGCIADLSGGDVSWWDYSEAYPFGWTIGSGGTNTNIAFNDCLAQNNRMNDVGYVDGVLVSGTNHKQTSSYWNGDGFSIESNTGGTVQFNRCVSVNNEDGGYDIKAAAVFTDCSAVRNHRGFRCWDTAKTLNNCIAAYPFSRSYTSPNGAEGGQGVWIQNGTVTLDFFTFHGNAGTACSEEGSGTGTFTNSILSFTGTSGTFTAGSVTLGAGTVTYRPGSGVDPAYVAPSETWDGFGTDMNSTTYGTTKGWTAP